MTVQQLQKRNGKAQQLKVIRSADGVFAVESSEGKIMYIVTMDSEGNPSCSCADYARGKKSEPNFRCKHILAVMDSDAEIEEGAVLGKRQAKLDSRFIKSIQGREFCLYAGLLDYCHQKGLIRLSCEIIQYPTKDNDHECICRATAETKNGEVFTDIGDANRVNVNKMIASHLIRMASTRAKARCLRDLANIGMTCLEELTDINEVIPGDSAPAAVRSIKAAGKKTVKPAETVAGDTHPEPKSAESAYSEPKATPVNEKPITSKADTPSKSEALSKSGSASDSNSPKISAAQRNATLNLARRRGISMEELEKMINTAYGVSVDELTSAQASAFIRTLQSAA